MKKKSLSRICGLLTVLLVINTGCKSGNQVAKIDCTGITAASIPSGSLQKVERANWVTGSVPEYINMFIYVPDVLADNPPVVVSCHSCGNSAEGQFGNNKKILAAADKDGFIVVFPDNRQRNCWDVGTEKALTHDGGGDTQAVAEMVKYTLCAYNGDPDRVFVMGGSSGAMMTQALLAVYPDVFKAGSARAGVPAGCWAEGYSDRNQWGGECSGGRVSKTAEEWGDLARAMYADYNGPRPRVQLFQGMVDRTISYNNMGEAIKQWTNVLGLDAEPTVTDTIQTPISTYNRQFWMDDSGRVVLEVWHGVNGGHSMGYEEDDILRFFGLDDTGSTLP